MVARWIVYSDWFDLAITSLVQVLHIQGKDYQYWMDDQKHPWTIWIPCKLTMVHMYDSQWMIVCLLVIISHYVPIVNIPFLFVKSQHSHYDPMNLNDVILVSFPLNKCTIFPGFITLPIGLSHDLPVINPFSCMFHSYVKNCRGLMLEVALQGKSPSLIGKSTNQKAHVQ